MTLILVVEDEAAIADVVRDVLEDEGYSVRWAGNGRDGLAAVAEQPPQLVLSDIMMPVLDGRAMCRAIQSDPRYRHIPIVLMSAAALDVAADTCRYAAFVRKPFDLDRLLGTVLAQIGPPQR